jgi:hypothetical protein
MSLAIDHTGTTPPNKVLVMDEFWRIGEAFRRDEDLLKVQGVPNARYLVRGDAVFVFSLLANRVRDAGFDPAANPEAVLGLMNESWVDAFTAVTKFNIEPHGYSIDEDSTGYYLRCEQLQAWIPVIFPTWHDARCAMADVLLGKPVATTGEFEFDGQWLRFIQPLTLDLPDKPECSVDAHYKADCGHFTSLSHLPGLIPFDRGLYDHVKALVDDWEAERDAIKRVTSHEYVDVWAAVTRQTLPIVELNVDLNDPESADENTEAAKLVEMYPELAMLSKQHLYDLFYGFMSDRLHRVYVDATRDEDFALYLLGSQVAEDQDEDLCFSRGCYAWFALKRGDNWGKACEFALACEAYDKSVSTLSWRIRDAMSFLHTRQYRQLELDALHPPLPGVTRIGNPVDSLSRMMKNARKHGVADFSADQELVSTFQEKIPQVSPAELVSQMEIITGQNLLSNGESIRGRFSVIDYGSHTYDFITLNGLGADMKQFLSETDDKGLVDLAGILLSE